MIRVLILGAGFGSINLAQHLSKLLKNHSNVELMLVNEHNYFLFQPMLPLVASAAIEATHIVTPIRRLCPRIRFHKGTVHQIDLTHNRVKVVGGEYADQQYIAFDHLVIGMGTTVNLGMVPGLKEHSIPIKSLGDAFYIRNEVINKLERASVTTDPELKKALLTFTIVGAGFSGVETVGQIYDMLVSALRQYRSIHMSEIQMVLIHAQSRILNELDEKLARYAEKKLTAKGIKLYLGVRIEEATQDHVRLTDSTVIHSKTVISAIGTAPHPVIKQLFCADESGKIQTNSYFQVLYPDQQGVKQILPNIWALGDCANVPDLSAGEDAYYGPTAQVAVRQGKVLAKNIWNFLNNKPMSTFNFKPIGQLVNIGHFSAVAQILGVCFSGFFAYLIWRFVYWLKLPSLQCQMKVIVDGLSGFFFSTDITQLDVYRTEALDYAHFSKDMYIFKKGDISDYFYIIETGLVEIIKTDHHGKELMRHELSAGDSFGEMGLIEQSPRSAAARCKTSVQVIRMDPKSFQELNKSYSSLRQSVNQKMDLIRQENIQLGIEPSDNTTGPQNFAQELSREIDHIDASNPNSVSGGMGSLIN